MSLTVMVDGLFVGNLVGTAQLAALNVISPLVMFTVMIYVLIGFGGSTHLSVLKGKLETENNDRLFTIHIALLAVIGLLMTTLSFVFKEQLVDILCSEESLHDYVIQYLDVYCLQYPFFLVFGGLAYFCRIDNSPKIAAVAVITANLVNIVLDYVYIEWFDLGIAGAAWASFSGYIVGYVALFVYLKSKQRTLFFTKTGLALKNLRLVGESIRYSGPSAFNEGVVSVCLVGINSMVLTFVGVDGMSVYTVFNQASLLYILFLTGVAESMAPVVGVSLGERDTIAVKFVLRASTKILVTSALLCFALFEIFPVEAMAVFGITDPAVVEMGIPIMRILTFSLIPAGLPYFLMFYYQLVHRDSLSMMIVVFMNVLAWLPVMWLLGTYVSPDAIWWSQAISEVATIIFIVVVTYFIAKRSHGRFKGIFLIDTQMNAKTIDLTLSASSEHDVKSCSTHIHDFLAGQGYLNPLCTGVIDLFVREVNHRAQAGNVDVVVSCENDEVTMRLRDKYKQSTERKHSDEFEGMEIIRYDFQEVLNLNVATYVVK